MLFKGTQEELRVMHAPEKGHMVLYATVLLFPHGWFQSGLSIHAVFIAPP